MHHMKPITITQKICERFSPVSPESRLEDNAALYHASLNQHYGGVYVLIKNIGSI